MNHDDDIELLELTSTHEASDNVQTSSIEDTSLNSSAMNDDTIIFTNTSDNVQEKRGDNISIVSKSNVSKAASNSSKVTLKQKESLIPVLERNQNGKKKVESEVGNSDDSASNILPNSPLKFSKLFFLIIIFFLLLGTIVLLPYSQNLFSKLFFSNDEKQVKNDIISTGRLVCTMDSNDNFNSYQYTETYFFDDDKVSSLEHRVIIQGNADYLNVRNSQCQLLQQKASAIFGVAIDCELSSGEMIETQSFNLYDFDLSSISVAYTEAGGIFPNVTVGDNYKEIQRVMKMSGYDCEIR